MRCPLRPWLAVTLFSISVTSAVLGDCQCSRPQKGETTHWGGNMSVVVAYEKPYRQVHGVVRLKSDEGPPMKGALIEIFTHPEYLLRDSSNGNKDKPKQRRIAACRTGAD